MKNNNSKSIKEICEIFWELENNFDLIDVSVQDIKIWQAIRFKVFRYISELTGSQEQAHTKLTDLSKLKKLSSYILNSFKNNPFFRRKCDVVVFSHPRPKLVDGKVIDIYTKYFLEKLKKDKVDFLELESAYLGEHKKDLNNNTSYTDFIVLMTNLLKKIMILRLSKEEKILINNINLFLSDSFGIRIDITNILIDSIKIFKIKNYLYTKLFKILKPNKLYIVVSYGNPEIIKSAKDLKIKVIELQHGIFSDFHLGYSYPNREKELDYFPDEFLVWSQYWKDLIKLPIDYDKIKIKPFEFLECNKEKYKNMNKLNQIVILSQGNIGNTMAQLVLDNIKTFKDIKIMYKLHPGEYDRYKNYQALNKLIEEHKNIEIIEDCNLHKLLATSKYQLGVNSTALLEGIELGCKTMLFDISGIEYMYKFIKFYTLKKVNNMFMSDNMIKEFKL